MDGYYDDNALPFPAHTRTWITADEDASIRTRNVLDLRLKELLPDAAAARRHRRREPVVIDGEQVQETLRERLTRESRELEIAVTQLANQLAKRTAQLEHLQRFPTEDPFADGTTLQFEKSFPANPDTHYSYAAHRANGRWYITGERSPQGITWQRLIDWMGLGVDSVYQLPSTKNGRRRKVIG